MPLGFICGWPRSGTGGDLYGGNVYVTGGAAKLSTQSKAIHAANVLWGSGRVGRQCMPFTVCKEGFQPWTLDDSTNELRRQVPRALPLQSLLC